MRAAIKNNSATQLTSAIGTTNTSINVLNAALLPTLTAEETYFYVTLLDGAGVPEIVKVTAVAGNTLTVVRAQDDTTARSFGVGTTVSANIVASLLKELASKDNPTFTGNILIASNSGGNRVIGFAGGTNTTLVLQAGAASGSGANLELTNDYYAYLDANTFRSRSADGSTIFTESSVNGFDVKSGTIKQAGVALFDGLVQVKVVSTMPATPVANTLYIVTT